MSQIIVAQNVDGIVMACENRAIQLDEKGNEISLQINRLLPLTPHCALLISGSAEGRDMGSALKNFLLGEKLNDVQEIYGTAVAYLSTEYETIYAKEV